MKNNIVGWLEIPVNDMGRAITFYENVLDLKLTREQMGSLDMAWFPHEAEGYGSGGALVFYPQGYKTSVDGVLIYLTASSGNLANELSKVENAGGKILQDKTRISEEHGFMAILIDSEGNRVALHSRE